MTTLVKHQGPLLALDAGTSSTGWAVFGPDGAVVTSTIGLPRRQRIDTRLTHLSGELDRVVEEWLPVVVVRAQPTRINWGVPASLELLDIALAQWAGRHCLTMYTYTDREVLAGLTGNANTSSMDLAYATMVGTNMLGVSKSSREWMAIAIGHYHLGCDKPPD